MKKLEGFEIITVVCTTVAIAILLVAMGFIAIPGMGIAIGFTFGSDTACLIAMSITAWIYICASITYIIVLPIGLIKGIKEGAQ